MGAVAQQFMTLGAAVVQEVAKLKLNPRNSVRCACMKEKKRKEKKSKEKKRKTKDYIFWCQFQERLSIRPGCP